MAVVPGRELPVADPWFVTRPVSDGVTLITEPHVHPLLRCNVWHVRGRDRDLVIDTVTRAASAARTSSSTSSITRCSRSPRTSTATTSAACPSSTDRAIHRVEADVLAESRQTTLVARATTARPCSARTATPGYDIPELLVDAVPDRRLWPDDR